MDAIEESGGFFSSLLGSVRSHVEDRIKSPFAGAFVLAWLAVNWKAILIVTFSSTSIEARIAALSASHLSIANTLLWPLLYAFIGVVGYYLIATIFLVAFEFYGIGRRFVERKFDSHRWVDPESYINLKQEARSQIDYYAALAADKVEKISQLTSDVAKLDADKKLIESSLEEKTKEVQVAAGKVEILAAARHAAEVENKNLTASLKSELEQLAKARVALTAAESALSKSASFVSQSKPATQDAGEKGLMGLLRPPIPSIAENLQKEVENARRAILGAIGNDKA